MTVQQSLAHAHHFVPGHGGTFKSSHTKLQFVSVLWSMYEKREWWWDSLAETELRWKICSSLDDVKCENIHPQSLWPDVCVLPPRPRPLSRGNSRCETWGGLVDASLSPRTWGGRWDHSTWRTTGPVYWTLHVLRQRHRRGEKQTESCFTDKLCRCTGGCRRLS